MVSAYLRRGLAAGLLAGLLAGLFAFFVGEPLLDRAIAIEEASAGGHHDEEVFSRPTQKAGLFFATGLFGATVGGVFGLAFAFFRGRLASDSDFRRSVYLTGALSPGVPDPFLKYPAEPAAVGPRDHRRPHRRVLHAGALSLCSSAAWLAARCMRERGTEAPDGARGGRAGCAGVWLFFALPAALARASPRALVGFRLSSSDAARVLGGARRVFGCCASGRTGGRAA
jgi:hypothetical protein